VKVICLPHADHVYSANAYLILGTWNHIGDANTLIDVGADASILREVDKASTGVGKNAVDQVILTHNHFDHNGGLAAVREHYKPVVFAHCAGDGVNVLVKDGQLLRAADGFLQVIHTPGHSSDSICLYSPELKALFCGDVPLVIRSAGSSYSDDFVAALEKISKLDIRVIYSGHDVPISEGAHELIRMTLANVHNSGQQNGNNQSQCMIHTEG
jgi:glyoxylase-like metal-dependent hydrolase (beta-lactamase superfamily II)